MQLSLPPPTHVLHSGAQGSHTRILLSESRSFSGTGPSVGFEVEVFWDTGSGVLVAVGLELGLELELEVFVLRCLLLLPLILFALESSTRLYCRGGIGFSSGFGLGLSFFLG